MNKKFLIAISTYKEEGNIVELLKKIRNEVINFKILIINDNSNDNTKNLINQLNDQDVCYLERPKKLGLGTAHKLSMLFAIRNNYDFLITMDADFSHDPIYLKSLIKLSNENNFVIGSRFCKDGKSDYKGFRKILSKYGNYFAKKILNLDINEITTYYRVYSVKILKKIPFNELNAQGYSLGVRIIWLMKKLGVKLIETPIHFKDRNYGKSKIPKFQIIYSLFDLFAIKFKDIFFKQKFYENNKTYIFNLKCSNCNNNFLSLKKKNKYDCMVCGNIIDEKY